jgi:MSHA pilin protein MshD
MTKRHLQGFTLIELVIFIVVVSAGLAGILSVMDTSVKSSADPMVRKQVIALADSILEEVLLKPYADPDGTNAGETGRANWDNVDDYNGRTNVDFTDLPAELASYVITIAVADGSATLGVPARKVVVTIRRGAESVSMTGYRSNY